MVGLKPVSVLLRKSFAVFMAFLALFGFFYVPCCCAVDSAEAISVLNQAEDDLGSAFVAVSEAEVAGADVSALLSKLSNAGDTLSEGYAAFRIADYEGAFALANECGAAIKGIVSEAVQLKADAENAKMDRLVFAGVASGVGLLLLVVLGFLGWRLLKRWYYRRVLDMKPELVDAQ